MNGIEISSTNEAPGQFEADAIVVGVFEDAPLPGPAAAIDRECDGLLTRLLESKEVSGKLAETTLLYSPAGIQAPLVLVTGLGEHSRLSRSTAFQAVAAATRRLAKKQRDRIACYLPDDWSQELIHCGIAGAMVGCHGQDLYRAEKKTNPHRKIVWSGASDHDVATGKILGESINLTRHLVNEPASEIYPKSFAEQAEQVAANAGLEIEIWDEQKLQAERCGSLLGVAQGSSQPPRLVIMRHQGAGPDDPTLALVGKGVTFDSGGLSLKPSDGMKTMKSDMAGAATVVGAMNAIGKMKIRANVIGLAGLVENMVSGDSYKLGDVLTARNGKTIEILNTDAEGRLVLADVLDVAVQRGATRIIDLATLTGACVVALGMDVAGLMTNDQSWCDVVADAAGTCGEPAWQLPMFSEFGEQIRSEVADIKNIGEGRWGGAITAAKFLEEFVGDTPWVHIDIAGPSFLDKPKPWIDAGGSGAFVRTLVEVAQGGWS